MQFLYVIFSVIGSKVRLSTLELTIRLLKLLVYREEQSFLQDRHLACIENARECSTQLLRNFYKVSSQNNLPACIFLQNLSNLSVYFGLFSWVKVGGGGGDIIIQLGQSFKAWDGNIAPRETHCQPWWSPVNSRFWRVHVREYQVC